MSTADTVDDRIAVARETFSPVQLALGLGLVALVAGTLLFLQEPAAHDAMHDFRHAAGITCH